MTDGENWSCIFGKHHFKISHYDDNFLFGDMYFKCALCGVGFMIDKLALKMFMMGRSREAMLIIHGR